MPMREIGRRDRVDIIMTNPPFGGEEERGILSNFPENMQTSETALLYLQFIMRKLRKPGDAKRGGRAAVVVPDGTLSGPGIAATIRQELLNNFRLYAVVQLPPGAFAPYAESARTNILFFDSEHSTDNIWYCQVLPPDGRKQCSKNNPLSEDDFKAVQDCWLGKKDSPYSWFVSRADIDPITCELLRRNPKISPSAPDLNIDVVVRDAAISVQNVLAGLSTLEKSQKVDDAIPRPLGQLLQRSQCPCVLNDSEDYKQLTIQYHYRGVKLRGIQKGAQISTKRQFSVTEGQMVLSRIDARYGALGFVPPELSGAVITGDFWAFDVNTAEVLPAYLDLFFCLPVFATLCERASRGTTRRQRLESHLFNSICIPWVPIDRQQVIVDSVGIATGISKLLEGVAENMRSLPRELINQSFGFSWIEENIERMFLSEAGSAPLG